MTKENLIAYLERKMSQMDRVVTSDARLAFFNQAFGAVDFICQFSTSEEFKDLEALWREWRPKFEEKVWEKA